VVLLIFGSKTRCQSYASGAPFGYVPDLLTNIRQARKILPVGNTLAYSSEEEEVLCHRRQVQLSGQQVLVVGQNDLFLADHAEHGGLHRHGRNPDRVDADQLRPDSEVVPGANVIKLLTTVSYKFS